MSSIRPPVDICIRGTTPERPYCWQSKDARRRIREYLDQDTSMQKIALAVYDAITELASNKQMPFVKAPQSYIGSTAGGYEVRSVQRVLPILKELGLVHYEEQKGIKQTLTYTLCSVATDSHIVTTGEQNATQSHNRSNTRINSKKKHTEYDDDFLQFYDRYPVKKGKQKAYEAWAEISSSRPPLADLLEFIEIEKVNSWKSIESKFIPHPATWLRDERWKNNIKPVKATNTSRLGVDEQCAFNWRCEVYPDSMQVHPTWNTFPFNTWPKSLQDQYHSYKKSLKNVLDTP